MSSTSSVDYSTIGKTQAYINQQNAESSSSSNTILDQEDFLLMLTTQLENQDPTEPVDNSQMVTQLSQLSMMESLTTISDNMSSIVSSVNSSAALSASSLVGRSVLVSTDEGFFDGVNPIYAKVDAGSTGATDITIVVKDANGSVVAEYTAASGVDEMQFVWDGIKTEATEDSDAEYYPAGMYTIEATGMRNGTAVSLPISMYATVGSVTLGASYSDTILNLVGYGNVTLGDIEEISL